jgi:hypothetical protein
MSKVTYDGIEITPTPIIGSLQRNYNKTQAGQLIGFTYTLELRSKIVSKVGFDDLMTKKEALASILDCPGGLLVISCDDVILSELCVNAIDSLTFSETPDNWATSIDWSATLQVSEVTSAPSCPDIVYNLNSVNDTWSIQRDESINPGSGYGGSGDECLDCDCIPVYNVQRSLVATANPTCTSGDDYVDPWTVAKSYCDANVGFDTGVFAGYDCFELGSFVTLNHTRVYNVDKSAGSYSVNEAWVVRPGQAGNSNSVIETSTFSISQSNSSNVLNVSIQGQIIGLDSRGFDANGCFDALANAGKYQNARDFWENTRKPSLHTKAEIIADRALNAKPVGGAVTHNPCAGVINYNYNYNSGTFCMTEITGYDILSESVEVSVSHPRDIYSEVYVIGRPCPIIRDLGIRSKGTKTLSLGLVVAPTGDEDIDCSLKCYPPFKPQSDDFFADCYGDLTGEYGVVALDADNETWNVTNGSYRRTITWSYSECCEPEQTSNFSLGSSNEFAMDSSSYQASFYENATITGADSGDEIVLPRARQDIGKRVNLTNLSNVELAISLSPYDSFGTGSLTSIPTGDSVVGTVITADTWKVI